MGLSRKEFDLLVALAGSGTALSQRQMARLVPYSLATINRALQGLAELGYAMDGAITEEGLSALEPYRAKRAIFLAAGVGSRLLPITLNTPKPLIRVHGKRLIDGLIDACLAAGIREIYIVRGYLAEQFDQLLYRYPMLRLVENPDYNEANNISSAMPVRHLLANAYVFESDLLIRNPSIIRAYHYAPNFLGIRKARSDDWCFRTKGHVIVEQKVGGLDCYQEIGISYWDREAGEKLRGHLEQAYQMPGGRELFWERVPLGIFPQEYRIEIRECAEEDICEIDTYKELKAIDKAYDM